MPGRGSDERGTAHFARGLAAARLAAGLSRTELAARAGLRPARLGAIESGTRPVAATELYALAAALGVPFIHFFQGLDRPGPAPVAVRAALE